MSLATSLLPEFDREMAHTRRLLERVPKEQPCGALVNTGMKAYLLITGGAFGLLVVAHVSRVYEEGVHSGGIVAIAFPAIR